ncbi:hypothetical protein RISK_002592 [Rhodopirellula islandica]|uniref:Uncharacterized protein n=1 Tax=Rhodopirellula islandica TaxID=595434 RepID=A0A0J1BFQ9_RHOIS|nr:hypothetical protein RISK_002592 [Rhodopirellula islandica]
MVESALDERLAVCENEDRRAPFEDPRDARGRIKRDADN